MLFKRPSSYASNSTAGPSQSDILSAKFPPWLWTACTNALDILERDPENGIRFTAAARNAHLNHALKQLPNYPVRPSTALPLSPTVDHLRTVLAEAPSQNSPKGNDGYPEGLLLDETDHIDGETFWRWTQSYTDRIYGALIALIEEHGTEANGWESVRWEVYDKARHSYSLLPTILSTFAGAFVPDLAMRKMERSAHSLILTDFESLITALPMRRTHFLSTTVRRLRVRAMERLRL